MATKAENFRYESERSGPKQPKKSKPPRRDAEKGSTSARDRSLHAARKGGVKLEESLAKPSRKSTRGGKGRVISQGTNEEGVATKRHGEGHVKTAANLTLRATVTTRSPSERSHRGRSPSRGVAPSR